MTKCCVVRNAGRKFNNIRLLAGHRSASNSIRLTV